MYNKAILTRSAKDVIGSNQLTRERYEEYRQVVHNHADLLVCVDTEFNRILVNQRYCQVFGGTEDEYIGSSFLSLVYSEDLADTIEEIGKTFEPPYCCYHEHREQTIEGLRWIGWSYSAILDDANNVVEIVAVGRDMTNIKNKEVEMLKYGSHLEKVVRERTNSLLSANQKLKQEIAERIHIEKALLESHNQYNLMLSSLSDLVVLLGVRGPNSFEIVNISDSCCKEFKITRDLALGTHFTDTWKGETGDLIHSAASIVLRNGEAERFSVLTKEKKHFHIGVFPAFDEANACSHIIVVGRDITQKMQIEEQQLKVEKLESLGLMAGGIAHDFNNILTAIIGNVSLVKAKLSRSDRDDSIIGMINQVEKASLQAKDLTQQLLTFAKGGNPILKIASIDELVRESAEFALIGSNVKCNYHLPDDLWTTKIDQGQFNQVVNNLVINAHQAMRGGGTIEIMAENVVIDQNHAMPLNAGRYIQLSIEDHGEGISEDVINKIFDPYFSTKEMGSGLGLTTTYSIVRKHGGFITVESEKGFGTKFNILLPASEEGIEKSSITKTNSVSSSGKGKILVMDDEKMVRYVLSEMLTHLGYEVSTAKDGIETISYYKSAKQKGTSFDAVIMDLTIPGGMGGKETIQKLKEIDPQIKAIVSSGYSNDPVMSDYKKYGFLAVVLKPYGIEELGETLNSVILQTGNDSKAS